MIDYFQFAVFTKYCKEKKMSEFPDNIVVWMKMIYFMKNVMLNILVTVHMMPQLKDNQFKQLK